MPEKNLSQRILYAYDSIVKKKNSVSVIQCCGSESIQYYNRLKQYEEGKVREVIIDHTIVTTTRAIRRVSGNIENNSLNAYQRGSIRIGACMFMIK